VYPKERIKHAVNNIGVLCFITRSFTASPWSG